MPREIPTPISNKNFTLEALLQGHRLDGRSPLTRRPLQITFPDPEETGVNGLGRVEVQLGKTKVLARVSAGLTNPRGDRPFEGLMSITSEIGPMAGEAFHGEGRTTEEEVILTRLMEKAIRRSEAVDREALCVVAGEKVWHIKLHLHFLSSDGNLIDAGCIAGMTALRHFRRPEVERVEDTSGSGRGSLWKVYPMDERAPIPLSIHHTPLCVTFAYLEGNLLVLDPTLEETRIAVGTLTLTLNAQRELCVLSKAGGSPLTADEIMKVVRLGVDIVREMSGEIDEALKLDASVRVIEVV